MTEETFAVALSAQTAARIKWEMIADLINAVGGSINRRRSEQEKMPTELPPDYVEKGNVSSQKPDNSSRML